MATFSPRVLRLLFTELTDTGLRQIDALFWPARWTFLRRSSWRQSSRPVIGQHPSSVAGLTGWEASGEEGRRD